MNEMRFVQLQESGKELFDMAKEVWFPFIHEVNANDGKEQSDDEIISGKTDPDDQKPILIKKIAEQKPCAKIITIQISKYLTNPLAGKIAMMQWHSDAPKVVNHLRNVIYGDSYFYDCFDVIATDQNDDVVGRLHCIQNETDKSLWYYGDLSVIPEYRRMGIATRMIRATIDHLTERGAKTLRTYVDPGNAPSIALQKSIGFAERPYQIFNELLSDGQMMFEFALPPLYSVIPAGPDEAIFVMMFYRENIEKLHGKPRTLDEWKEILSSENEDDRNFLICRGCMPVAWLQLSGLLRKDMARISMLAVSDKHQRQGVGRYTIEFAEKFIKELKND